MTEERTGPRRSGGRAGRQAARRTPRADAVPPGLEGGSYRPLSDSDVRQVHGAVLEVLSTIGIADATPALAELARERGGTITGSGRLCFSPALIEDVLASAPREFSMYSRDGKTNVRVGGRRVYFATSDEAI